MGEKKRAFCIKVLQRIDVRFFFSLFLDMVSYF
ncbi:Putative protein [Zobellia galactanivorans]|uniref:Uncharacterized protein n=1 Tax=Zobellia galactanivorans (strain DSM 12802 / CCUG 47099 / CIP 106680 / NCIMB 13871 / Dsij) TaxID=63186 RepID=G0L4H6_ZOBGA|nr:Putative protein [Zobellia galactanivorans]